jgi:hypothetical protein
VKRFALRGGTAFVVFKDIKISLVPKALGICFFFGRCKKEKEHKCYRDINKSHDFKLLLDTIFYRKSPTFQGTQAGSK